LLLGLSYTLHAMNVISRFKALMLKNKGKIILATPSEGLWGSGFTAPLIINLCYKWKWMVKLHFSADLFPSSPTRRKTHWFWLKRRLGGPQGRRWRFEEEKITCIFGSPSGFIEALIRLGCFVLSFARFLPTFRWILWRMIDPKDEAATILRNEGIIRRKVTA